MLMKISDKLGVLDQLNCWKYQDVMSYHLHNKHHQQHPTTIYNNYLLDYRLSKDERKKLLV